MPKKLTTEDLAVPLVRGRRNWAENDPKATTFFLVCCNEGADKLFWGLPRQHRAGVVLHLTQKWPGENHAVLLEFDSLFWSILVNGEQQHNYFLRLRDLVCRFEDDWCYAWVELPA